MSFGGYDPNKAAIANQRLLKQLCFEIERSANTGIGYAFSLEHLVMDNRHLLEPSTNAR